MTELEQYVEDMRKNMSSNQLEMKVFCIAVLTVAPLRLLLYLLKNKTQ